MSNYLETYRNANVVVAGGASGIGAQLVLQLDGTAKKVIVIDRDEAAAAQVIANTSASVSFIALDMDDPELVDTVIQQCAAELGSVDFFFNAAGSFMAGEIRDTSDAQWMDSMHDNYAPVAAATTYVYSLMRSQGYGHIITLASSAGLFPVPVMSLYGASKSAVVTAMLGLRMEAQDFNIKVSVVCPTVVDTPLYDRATYAGLKKESALHFLRSRDSVQKPAQTAQVILKKIAKNKAVVHTAASTYWAWVLYRISPSAYMMVAQKAFGRYRKDLRSGR